MIKVVLWDYTGESSQWSKNFLRDGVEIVRTLRPDDPDQADVIMRGDWDFVLIFEQDQRELFDEIFKVMRDMNVSIENIVFAKDFNGWLNNPRAVYALLKPETCEAIYRHWNFFNHRKWHRYISASAEGFHYLATAADDFLIRRTYVGGQNHTANELKFFRALSRKYYGVDDSIGGIFLELGANIGTTGIYFIKKFAPNMKWLAFEPDAENFKLLRINTILNDMEDKATLVNCGLGDKFDEMIMYRDLKNPGHNNFTEQKNNVPTAKVKIIPLDSYLAENKIAASDVKYIWIDTEGFEPQVLLGAKNLLKENPAPIFMEFNPMIWNKSGYFEHMMNLLEEVGYTHWIWVLEMIQRGEEKVYPLNELWQFKNSNREIGSLGDIFLIKKGAIA